MCVSQHALVAPLQSITVPRHMLQVHSSNRSYQRQARAVCRWPQAGQLPGLLPELFGGQSQGEPSKISAASVAHMHLLCHAAAGLPQCLIGLQSVTPQNILHLSGYLQAVKACSPLCLAASAAVFSHMSCTVSEVVPSSAVPPCHSLFCNAYSMTVALRLWPCILTSSCPMCMPT